MLLVGGVLGLMHRGLSPDTRPSAVDWRIGTLLLAGGSVLLMFQQGAPPGLLLPVANACLMFGVTLYWRAVRRFYGEHDALWLFLPALLATLGFAWFVAVSPSLAARVAVTSFGWGIPIFAAAWTLHRHRHGEASISRAVLAGLFLVIGLFLVFRGLYFVLYPGLGATVLDRGHWLSAVTPLIVLILPVVGTTAFLLLCVERIRRQWENAAATDYLTGLPNRRTITHTGESRFNAARRSGRGFAVAVIDIDHFKSINDRYGHEGGDLALKHIAAVLERSCRGPSMVGRQGGEEFVALFDDIDTDGAQAVAERIRQAVESSPVPLGQSPLVITASIGVSVIAPGDRQFDDLLQRADHAVYAAKTGGRNRVEMAAA